MRKRSIAEIVKSFFSTNISLKIFSLIFAFAVWFIVMTTLNPAETKTFNIPLTISGADQLEANDLVCLNLESLESQVIKVRVNATRPELNTLASGKDKITASVDLGRFSEYYNEDLSEPFYVSVVPNLSDYTSAYEIVGYSPTGISVSIDRMVDFEVPVRVLIENETEGSYVHDEPMPAVNNITVRGPESMVGEVSYAGLPLDLSQVTDDSITEIIPVLYDADDKEIESELFTTVVKAVQVSTSVLMQGELEVQAPKYVGKTASGYSVTDVKYSPEILKVVGKEDNIKNVAPLLLPEINIANAKSNITKTFDVGQLLRERGLSPQSEEDSAVNVEIVVEKAEPMKITIPASKINITGIREGLKLTSSIDDLSLEVYGNKDAINSSDIYANVDLSGLGAGSHRVKVSPVLPSEIELEDEVYINIELSLSEDDASEASTENDEAYESETSVGGDSLTEDNTEELGG